MRRFGIGIVLVGLVAVSAAGQEAITLKVPTIRAGQRGKVTVEEKTTTKSTFTVMGTNQSKDEVKGKSLVYVEDAIEFPNNAKLATKLKRTYEKASTSMDGNSTRLPIEGKTVLIEKKGEKYAFTIDGEALTGDALKLLDAEFNKPDKQDPDVMLPKTPVKPGETWKIDMAEFARAMGPNGPQFDKEKTTAIGKLVKTYKKDGKQFGVAEFTIDAPITSLGEKNPFTVKEGRMTMKILGDGCLDGTSPAGTMTAKIGFKLVGSGMGIDLKVEAEGIETKTMELIQK